MNWKQLSVILRPTYDGPYSWLIIAGIARITLLIVLVIGIYLIAPPAGLHQPLLGIYAAAFVCSAWYLRVLWRDQVTPPLLTWTQLLVDFGIVATTISLTNELESHFTFLLVIVILEAGILLGLNQGFVFATFASAFMLTIFLRTQSTDIDLVGHWYNFLIQCIAFYFTAFISGYWNQRVNRMKQFQREILDNMNSGFLITDTKGTVVGLNKAGCAILGYEESKAIGSKVNEVFCPKDGEESPVCTALRHGKDFNRYEFTVLTRRQDTRLLGMSTNHLTDLRNNPTGLIVSFSDLTELAELRQHLQQQDRLAVIGELTAGLAHEVRNPVASIRSSMEEVQKSIENPKMVQRLANIAVRESNHLNEIVTGFLDFARDPSRRYREVDVAAVAGEVAEFLRRKYEDQSDVVVEFHVNEQMQSYIAMGDMTQLRQVFINLGQNAIEAMEMDGLLQISMRKLKTKGPIEIRFDDEGPGIAPDKITRIFDPFYTEKASGVGMGLAICQRIITTHNGTIQAATRPEKGTTMLVRLPAVASERESES